MRRNARRLWAGAALVALLGTGVLLLWGQRGQPSATPLDDSSRAYDAGDWEVAATAARRHLAAHRNDPAAIRLLARSSIRLARDSIAQPLYQRLAPELLGAEDLYLMGSVMQRAGDRMGSIRFWEQALPLQPDHSEALFALGSRYLEGEQYHIAAQAASRLAALPEWRCQADNLLGKIHAAQNDAAGAIDCWERALRSWPSQSDPGATIAMRLDLARAHLRMRQPARARSQLRAVLELGPNPEASWLLSRALLQEGSVTGAMKALEDAATYAVLDPTRFEPAPYVGAARCSYCHFSKYQAQRVTRHARTFHRPAALTSLSLAAPSIADPAEAKVAHTLRMANGRLVQETHVEDRIFRAVVDYAFGSGDIGRSLIGRDEAGKVRELRLSVYQAESRLLWDVTPGQPAHPPAAEDYLGVPMTPDHLYGCFGCHVTSPRAVLQGTGPEADDVAIGCEKCHGPGGNHLLAVDRRFPDLAIGRPALVSGLPVVKICAQCHNGRSGAPVQPGDPDAVHFQTVTLTWSRCFTESDNNLDCVTCHDPHQDASTDTAYYEARCLTCHARSGSQTPTRKRRRLAAPASPQEAVVCPIKPDSGCIACHMPAVKGAISHTSPTDHFIRVHRQSPVAGEDD